MGFYVNPQDGTSKEDYLTKHGIAITRKDFMDFEFDGKHFPVCLVNNGAFTAAAVGYDKRERDEFGSQSDHRPKKFFIVPREHLADVAGLGYALRRY